MKHFVLSLLTCSLSMTVIALLFRLICRRLGNRYAARWRYGVWLVVLLGFLLPVRPALPSFQVISPAGSSPSGAAAPGGFDPYPILFLVWAAGSGLMLASLLSRHIAFRRTTARLSTPLTEEEENLAGCVLEELSGKPVPVQRCRGVSGPMAIGVFRPRILLPHRAYTAEELSLVLRHELTHCRRHDLLFQALLAAGRCLHWFNPLFPLIQRMMERDCELACDEAVLGQASADTRSRYCRLLLDTAAWQSERGTLLSTHFGGGKASLRQRLSSALDSGKRCRFLVVAAALLALTVGCGVFFPARAASDPPYSGTGGRSFDYALMEHTVSQAQQPDGTGSTFTAPTGGEDGAIGESDEGDDISFTTVVWNGDDF